MTDSIDPNPTTLSAADLRAEEARILREVADHAIPPPTPLGDSDSWTGPAARPERPPTIDDVEHAIRAATTGPCDYVGLAASAVFALYAPFIGAARAVETRRTEDLELADLRRRVREHGERIESLALRLEASIRAPGRIKTLAQRIEEIAHGEAPTSRARNAEDFGILFADHFTRAGRRWIGAAESMIAAGELVLGNPNDAELRALLEEIESLGSHSVSIVEYRPGAPCALEHDAVLEYLDQGIRAWRERRDRGDASPVGRLVGRCYVDALQSLRVSFFGSTLESEAGGSAR